MTRAKAVELGSFLLVILSAGLTGAYAAEGMAPAQWLGAAAAVFGSVVIAVAVRVWPEPARAGR